MFSKNSMILCAKAFIAVVICLDCIQLPVAIADCTCNSGCRAVTYYTYYSAGNGCTSNQKYNPDQAITLYTTNNVSGTEDNGTGNTSRTTIADDSDCTNMTPLCKTSGCFGSQEMSSTATFANPTNVALKICKPKE